MPNHVYINMEVNGKSNEVDAFFEKHIVDDSLDFNTFISMPDALKNTTYPVYPPENVSEFELAKWKRKQEEIKKKYGADNWYIWSVDNWGTKWNAYDCAINKEHGTISFCTAWSLPEPVIEKMAEMYPNLDFHFEVVEEGGFFAGTIDIQDGKVTYNLTEDNEEWAEYAAEFMGWDIQ